MLATALGLLASIDPMAIIAGIGGLFTLALTFLNGRNKRKRKEAEDELQIVKKKVEHDSDRDDVELGDDGVLDERWRRAKRGHGKG